jgi:hypothetical protein
MRAVTHLEKVIVGEVSAVTHLEKVIAGETSAVTYTEKVITGEAPPITHLQKVIAGETSPVTHLEYVWTGGTPSPTEHEYTGAVPVTITANGQPLIDYLISGNMEQSGAPTQETPIQPQETGDRTENLWNEDYTGISGSTKYVSVYVGNGSFTLSTSCPAIEGAAALFFLTGNVQSGASTVSNGVYKNRPITVTSTDGYVTVAYRYVSYATGSADPRNEKTMLNTGSTALPYEPYGYKILISSANITTPVYLGEVETTRKIKKLVLTGNENVSKDTGQDPTIYFLRYKHIQINSYCTHLRSVSAKPQSGEFSTVAQYDGYIFMNFGADIMNAQQSGNTVEGFKEYLAAQYAAGTPVTVWYVLATPETAVVNEPLMKIGDYADTLSMEQAGVQIPTLNGQTVIDVDTTLKPSEVYIKYQG